MDTFRWVKGQWDRTLAVVAAVLGAIFILLGWLGASDSTLATQQIPYLASGAVAGLFALGIAATLWLSADLRDDWRKLDDIHQLLREAAGQPAPEPATDGPRQGSHETPDLIAHAEGER